MKTYDVEPRTVPEQLTAIMADTLAVDEISTWLGTTYHTVAKVATGQGAPPVGPPFARFHVEGHGRFTVEAGFPVDAVIRSEGDVHPSWLPGGQVARTVHQGPYEEMEPAYRAVAAWVATNGGELVGDPWEVFLTDPQDEADPDTWRTEIVQPYRQAR